MIYAVKSLSSVGLGKNADLKSDTARTENLIFMGDVGPEDMNKISAG